MGPENNQKNLLSSWKEISGYLNCGLRTCHRWEKEYGLPVHRIEGAEKSPVFAYKEELDAWLKQKLTNNQIPQKRKIQFPKLRPRPLIVAVISLCAVGLGYFLISLSTKPSSKMQWHKANIVVSDPAEETLTVWSFNEQETFAPNLKAGPIRFARVAIDDIDNDGVPEIAALMLFRFKKKQSDEDRSKEGSEESSDEETELRIYPVVLEKNKIYNWPSFVESVCQSNMDYFVGKSGTVLALSVGEVDDVPGKELIVTNYDKIAVFRYDRKTEQILLLAERENLIEGIQLNLWSTAVERYPENGKGLIFVSAFQVGREERSFLLILEMVNDWPVVKNVVPSDTWAASDPLCIGDVIEGGTREIVVARTRRMGDWGNAYIIGWNLEGDKLFDFQLHEPQLTRARFRPQPRIAVGDLTPHPGDEILIIPNLENQVTELIVYRLEDLSLVEVSRHPLDFPSFRIKEVHIANLDNDAENEIFIFVRIDPGADGCTFLEIFDYDTDLNSLWREELLSNTIRDVAVSGRISN